MPEDIADRLALLELFLNDLDYRGFSKGTMKMYRSIISRAFSFINKPIEKWVFDDLIRLHDELEKQWRERIESVTGEKTDKEFSSATKELMTFAIRSFINYCLDHKKIKSTDIVFRSFRAKSKEKFKKYVELEELDSFFSKIENYKLRAMMKIQYLQMTRISELINLRFEDIHWDKDMIRIYGKRNKERFLPFDANARKILFDYILEFHYNQPVKEIREYMENRRRGRKKNLTKEEELKYNLIYNRDSNIFKLKDMEKKSDWVFPNKNNDKYKDASSIHKTLKRINQENNFSKKITTHCLRGSGATERNQNGTSIAVLKQLLGHESMDTTMRYIDVPFARVRAEMGEIKITNTD